MFLQYTYILKISKWHSIFATKFSFFSVILNIFLLQYSAATKMIKKVLFYKSLTIKCYKLNIFDPCNIWFTMFCSACVQATILCFNNDTVMILKLSIILKQFTFGQCVPSLQPFLSCSDILTLFQGPKMCRLSHYPYIMHTVLDWNSLFGSDGQKAFFFYRVTDCIIRCRVVAGCNVNNLAQLPSFAF